MIDTLNSTVVAISMTMNLISGGLTCPNATFKANITRIAMVALCCLLKHFTVRFLAGIQT